MKNILFVLILFDFFFFWYYSSEETWNYFIFSKESSKQLIKFLAYYFLDFDFWFSLINYLKFPLLRIFLVIFAWKFSSLIVPSLSTPALHCISTSHHRCRLFFLRWGDDFLEKLITRYRWALFALVAGDHDEMVRGIVLIRLRAPLNAVPLAFFFSAKKINGEKS